MTSAISGPLISVSPDLVSESVIDVGDAASPLQGGVAIGGADGATPALSFSSVLDFDGAIAGTPFDAWYDRIWIFPPVLRPINPQLDTDIPFGIFNAFNALATLSSISASGNTGLTLDIEATDTIAGLTVRDVNIQIGPTAPSTVSAFYTFVFDLDSVTFTFLATVVDFVTMFPDDPVTEILGWKTQIITNFDGSEQRIALREEPRRNVEFSFLLDARERRQQYRRMHRSLGADIVVPFYWYGARVAAAASAGATQIYFDPAKTDVRDGDYIVISDPVTLTGQIATIDEVQSDGATLTGTLASAITTRMIVAPGFFCRLIDRTGLKMRTVAGEVEIKAESLISRPDFARPGSAVTISTFGGYNVLDRQPVARIDSDEIFEAGYDLIDYDVGRAQIDMGWSHPFVSGRRQFRIDREGNPAEMDFWRDFLDATRGQQAAFLMQTWHSDLVPVANPEVSSNLITLPNAEYATELFPYETYKRLVIVSASGTVYREVESVEVEEDGTASVYLANEFGDDPADVAISRISFLNLVRLASDSVKLVHGRRYTILEMQIRTVDR